MAVDDPGIRMRPFPFPYRAGLAICSDIDSCDRRTFLAVHRFLNDPHRGLGLPVSDSFFPLGREPGQMAFFMPDGQTPGPDAECITAAIRCGLIDSIHSWGDFNGHPPEPSRLRALAEKMTACLRHEDLEIKLWVNHGAPENRQNMKARTRPEYTGDDPRSPLYTADLLQSLGVRHYWWSEVLPWPLSCHVGRRSARSCLRRMGNTVKNVLKTLAGRRERVRPWRDIMELCRTEVLRDGQKLMAFNRFNRHPGGNWAQPTRHALRYSLCNQVISELIAQEGYLILYTHLGQPEYRGGDLFQDRDVAVLQTLSTCYRNGVIWVATSSRLLDYWLVRHALDWKVLREGTRVVIELGMIHDPTTGSRIPDATELAGLCFYAPEPHITVVRMGGRILESVSYPPDHTGVASIGFAPVPPPDISLLDRFEEP